MEFVEYKKRKKQKIDSPLANQNKQVRTPREMIQPSNLDGGYFILFFCLSKKKRPSFSCCVGTEIYYAEALFFISLYSIYSPIHATLYLIHGLQKMLTEDAKPRGW